MHSLHNPDGGLASEVDWYEYDYVEPTQSNELKRRWAHVRRNEGGTWACLERSNYRAELEDAIRRYTKALDTREWDAAFVQLWGLLEDLKGERGKLIREGHLLGAEEEPAGFCTFSRPRAGRRSRATVVRMPTGGSA